MNRMVDDANNNKIRIQQDAAIINFMQNLVNYASRWWLQQHQLSHCKNDFTFIHQFWA